MPSPPGDDRPVESPRGPARESPGKGSGAPDRKDPGGLGRLAGQSLWNLLGLAVPLAVALVAIPVLLDHLGKDRFGVLGMIGLLIGYMSVFDFGLGQAQAYWIADCRGRGAEGEIRRFFHTGLSAILLLSLPIAGLTYLVGGWFALGALEVSPVLRDEVVASFRVIAAVVPFTLLTPALIATLEAFQRFRLINLVRIPTGASYFLAPLLVVPFTEGLLPVILALMAGRVLETLAFLLFAVRALPPADPAAAPALRSVLPRMFRFGGWITVTNLFQPLLIHADRFLLGALRSLAAATFYLTPAEFIIRILILPRAVVTALFPNLTIRFAEQGEGASQLFVQSLRVLLGLLVLGSGPLILFGPWALGVWLGPEFRESSGPVLQWLALGIVFLSLGYLPQYLLQASGKPSWPALALLAEAPVYFLLASTGILLGGALGAAVAWAVRSFLHLGIQYGLALRRLPELRAEGQSFHAALAAAAALLLLLMAFPDSMTGRLGGVLVLAAAAVGSWRLLMTAGERAGIRTLAREGWGRLRPRPERGSGEGG